MAEQTQTTTRKAILDAARELARSVAETEAYRGFEAASDAFRADPEARELLGQFQSMAQQVQMAASWGGSTQADREKLESAQARMVENDTLRRYLNAQEALVAQLKELDSFLTNRLGFDFADMTKPAGGCC